MLSYRHGYHAGGQADVLKHSVHAYCLDYLTRKPKPFLAMDTHAGAGIYDLAGDMADRTGEWREGVGRISDLTDVPALMQVWADIVNNLNNGGDVQIYPGSPEIARQLAAEIAAYFAH